LDYRAVAQGIAEWNSKLDYVGAGIDCGQRNLAGEAQIGRGTSDVRFMGGRQAGVSCSQVHDEAGMLLESEWHWLASDRPQVLTD
jgi:hypothetical protein